MKAVSLILLFLGFALLSMGRADREPEQIKADKAALLCETDSLYERIEEIDPPSGQNFDPEERREAMIRKYGKKKGPLIADGRVWIGLSTEMALDSWGKPENRKKSEGTWGMNETWYYPGGKYIFFENGRLSKWKD